MTKHDTEKLGFLFDHVYPILLKSDIMEESTVYLSIRRDERLSIARNLLQQGVSIEVVSIGTGLSIEEVQQIQSQINQPSPS
jgi:predicted transposase YdaD